MNAADIAKVNHALPSLTEIVPGLFVGNEAAAHSRRALQDSGITVIVNITTDSPCKFKKFRPPSAQRKLPRPKTRTSRSRSRSAIKSKTFSPRYLRIMIDDSLKRDDIVKMTQYLPLVVKFVRREMLAKRRVLIHCYAGMQRSAIVAAAYILKHCKNPATGKAHTPKSAMDFVIAKRPIAFHGGKSFNFVASLKHFNEIIKGRGAISKSAKIGDAVAFKE